MPTEPPRSLLEINYHRAAQDYLRKLPLEHFMEATPQATQREITVESFALVGRYRPDDHRFSELLVLYPLAKHKGEKKIGQVVPDIMIVLHEGPLNAVGSYDIPLQPASPFLVLEYVSKNSERKDYDDNLRKYEQDLKVPYYLLFYPEAQELTLYRHTGEKFVSVPPNDRDRYPLPELEMEVAIQDGWARYWFRDQLLPLPADLQDQVEKLAEELKLKDEQLQHKNEQLQHKNEQLQQAENQIKEERQRAETLAAELERLRQQLGQGES